MPTRNFVNRRREMRVDAIRREPVFWRRSERDVEHSPAVAVNWSSRGIGFVAPAAAAPHAGQSIDVWNDEGRRLGRYRVMRVHPQRDGTVEAGCARDHPPAATSTDTVHRSLQRMAA